MLRTSPSSFFPPVDSLLFLPLYDFSLLFRDVNPSTLRKEHGLSTPQLFLLFSNRLVRAVPVTCLLFRNINSPIAATGFSWPLRLSHSPTTSSHIIFLPRLSLPSTDRVPLIQHDLSNLAYAAPRVFSLSPDLPNIFPSCHFLPSPLRSYVPPYRLLLLTDGFVFGSRTSFSTLSYLILDCFFLFTSYTP